MPSKRTSQVDHVADLILRYLAQHPEAADTLEGIRTWWLPSQGYDSHETLVERALERLVADGKVVRIGQPPQAVYRRRRDG